jgi:hypothetical protein
MGLEPAWISLNWPVWSGSMLFAISFSTCKRIGKRTAWILIRMPGCAGWSGSMLVANPLYWFCNDTAHMRYSLPVWNFGTDSMISGRTLDGNACVILCHRKQFVDLLGRKPEQFQLELYYMLNFIHKQRYISSWTEVSLDGMVFTLRWILYLSLWGFSKNYISTL